ncbi:hypothetical protein BD289DRAFT_252416 [Coniella lustricola]|uniref:Uncharacterized protein n=1 Tax=Coniella lustricola TaxID=2025994 RepID=A0A2T3A8F0_9PEZI|nr:hypothetical protein BD289DRAFT_252416 [Coniella lustricola]
MLTAAGNNGARALRAATPLQPPAPILLSGGPSTYLSRYIADTFAVVWRLTIRCTISLASMQYGGYSQCPCPNNEHIIHFDTRVRLPAWPLNWIHKYHTPECGWRFCLDPVLDGCSRGLYPPRDGIATVVKIILHTWGCATDFTFASWDLKVLGKRQWSCTSACICVETGIIAGQGGSRRGRSYTLRRAAICEQQKSTASNLPTGNERTSVT